MTLEEAIQQEITLGQKDPLEIARRIAISQGDEWVTEQLALLAEDLVAELARRRLGSQRRGAELALRPGDTAASSELKIRSAWVPGSGWKRAADLTTDDLLMRAAWYERLAGASLRRASWCREVVDLMAQEGVKTLGKLKSALPPLPDEVEPLALEAVV